LDNNTSENTDATQKHLKKQHISGLDALRTLAIVGVTLFHMFPQTIKGGYLGVSLFFVLTGFLLAYTCQQERLTGKFSLGRYYLKRLQRIYPSLLLVIAVTVGVYHFLAPRVIAAVRPEVLSVVLGYNNWWQISQNADYFTRLTNTSPFTHLWFMGIELQYYFFWPVLLLLYAGIVRISNFKTGLGFLALLSCAAATIMPIMYQPGQDVTRLYYGTDTRLYALLFGTVLGLCKAQQAQKTSAANTNKISSGLKIATKIVYGFLLLVVLAAYLLLPGQSSFTYQGGMLLMTVIFCILLILTADTQLGIGKQLDLPLFTWIGKRSYGIFLWQYPVIYLFRRLGFNSLPLYPVLELLVICLLTIWSDNVSDCLTKFTWPFKGKSRQVILQGVLFLLVTLAGFPLFCQGCVSIVSSESNKTVDTNLQARLSENANALAKQKADKISTDQSSTAKATEAPATYSTETDQVKPPWPLALEEVACIGDSVMLGSAKELQQQLPYCYIDAQVSRYVGAGLSVAREMDKGGILGYLVVLSLGTNGPIAGQYAEEAQQMLDYIGPDRYIFWVNVYCPDLEWQDPNNAFIAKVAKERRNVVVIDWYSLISQHPEWLADDGIHPNDEGTYQYAKLIHDKMYQTLKENMDKQKKATKK